MTEMAVFAGFVLWLWFFTEFVLGGRAARKRYQVWWNSLEPWKQEWYRSEEEKQSRCWACERSGGLYRSRVCRRHRARWQKGPRAI